MTCNLESCFSLLLSCTRDLCVRIERVSSQGDDETGRLLTSFQLLVATVRAAREEEDHGTEYDHRPRYRRSVPLSLHDVVLPLSRSSLDTPFIRERSR